MNKRLIKKKLNRKKQFNGFVYAESNNGADFMEIENLEDGTVKLKSGSCCVMSINSVVPVEFITAILADMLIKHNYSPQSIIDSFGWSEDFKSGLKSKIHQYY